MPGPNYNQPPPLVGRPSYPKPPTTPIGILKKLLWGAQTDKRATSTEFRSSDPFGASFRTGPIDPIQAASEQADWLNKESGIYGLGSMLEEQNVMEGELSGLGLSGPPLTDFEKQFVDAMNASEWQEKQDQKTKLPRVSKLLSIYKRGPLIPPPLVPPAHQGDTENAMFGLGELASFGAGGEKTQQIIDAISSGIKNVSRAAKGEPVESSSELPLSKVLLILGGGYLLYKIIERTSKS